MAKTPSMGIDQNDEGTFIDRYFGRVPKFLHRIPEQQICEANPDYITLLNLVIDGKIPSDNISEELYRELNHFIDNMCNKCSMNDEDKALLRAFNGEPACIEPDNYVKCEQIVCCNDLFSCVEDQDCPSDTGACTQYAMFSEYNAGEENGVEMVADTGFQETGFPITRIRGAYGSLEVSYGDIHYELEQFNAVVLRINGDSLTDTYLTFDGQSRDYENHNAYEMINALKAAALSGNQVQICFVPQST